MSCIYDTPPDVIDQMIIQLYQMFLVYAPEQLEVQENSRSRCCRKHAVLIKFSKQQMGVLVTWMTKWSHSIVILRRGVYELNLDFVSTLQTNIYKQEVKKKQYLISGRGLQVPSIIGCQRGAKPEQNVDAYLAS